MPIQLKGITWNHTRGYLPMIATAQRFHETHPDVEISWAMRSLQEFADAPIQILAESFDLLVIDHPFVGYAAAHGTLVALDEHLPKEYLDDQAKNSVGASHASYQYSGHQWALAIDAATPVASWRPDLLDKPPRTWAELLALARQGRVAVPGVPVDTLMHWYMLCVQEGSEPLKDEAVDVCALEKLRELHNLCEPDCFTRNPIKTCEAMIARDDLAYCPFGYGYSNYSRRGYAKHLLQFGDLVDGLHSTLGGTGLAISTKCRHRESAVEYARYVASAECQRTLYTQTGGQPGHRAAWVDAENNRQTNNFFRDTLMALDRAYLRPRHEGYLHFQDTAGPVVQQALQGKLKVTEALRQMRKLDTDSRA